MNNEMPPAHQNGKQPGAVRHAAAGKNPKRVAAGRLNRSKRKGLTEEGRQRLRAFALKYRPWQFATGPRTAEGKAKVAANGRYRQRGTRSLRSIEAEIRQARAITDRLAELTRLLQANSETLDHVERNAMERNGMEPG